MMHIWITFKVQLFVQRKCKMEKRISISIFKQPLCYYCSNTRRDRGKTPRQGSSSPEPGLKTMDFENAFIVVYILVSLYGQKAEAPVHI